MRINLFKLMVLRYTHNRGMIQMSADNKNEVDPRLLPEINIGMLGHWMP